MITKKTAFLCVVTSMVTALLVTTLLFGILQGTGLLANPGASVPKLISYQGRLTDASGNPVANNNYSIEFRIYDVATGGTPLWSETENVPVSGGLFNVLLGSISSLSPATFAGNTYLEVVVGGEAMTPRQQIVSVPYAICAENAYTLGGIPPTSFATKSELAGSGTININTNPVDWTKMKNVPTGFADGVDDVGTGGGGLAEFLASNGVTRTQEDLGGGLYSIHVALADEYYSGSAYDARFANREALTDKGTINTGTNPVDWTKLKDVPAGVADGVDSDTLAGISATKGQVLKKGETGWEAGTDEVGTGGGTWTASGDNIYRALGNVGIGTTSPAQRLDVFGNAIVSGTLGANEVRTNTVFASGVTYTTPRTHYYSIPCTDFVPTGNVDYVNFGAGAYILSGSTWLIAPVHLPQGAVVTGFKVRCRDNSSSSDLEIQFNRFDFERRAYEPFVIFTTTGTNNEWCIIETTNIGYNGIIDNTLMGYLVWVCPRLGTWDSNNLMINSAIITYTLASAP